MKKRNVFFLFLFTAVVLTGCYDLSEEYTISADNSATYDVKMDMGRMLAMLAAFGGIQEAAGPEVTASRDTTVYFKSFTDTTTMLTDAQKSWIENGRVSVKMNVEEELFKLDIHFPF